MDTQRRTFLTLIASGLAALLPTGKQAAASDGAARGTPRSLQRQGVLRVTLDLNKAADQQQVKGQWRVGPGLVPGEPNEGLAAGMRGSPARLADYDDSGWEICPDIRERRSAGLTFAWYRIAVELPEQVEGVAVAGARVGSSRTSITTARSGSTASWIGGPGCCGDQRAAARRGRAPARCRAPSTSLPV